jgi:hypothetical protein
MNRPLVIFGGYSTSTAPQAQLTGTACHLHPSIMRHWLNVAVDDRHRARE